MNIETTINNNAGIIDLLGRLLLATIFVVSGIAQIPDFEGTAGYMQSKGVPGFMLYFAIILEIGGGLAVAAGWKTREFAFALAAFSLIAAFIFHTNWADEQQYYSFLKNLGMAGGMLVLMANGAGKISIDAKSA